MRKKSQKKFIDLLGWYGTVAIISAYAMSSFLIIKPDSLVYQFLNLTGAIGLIVETYSKKDYQPVVLNVIWSAVALFAIFQIIF